MDKETTLAPMASLKHREELHKQVVQAIAAGSTIVCGGKILDKQQGVFYPPSIPANVGKDNIAYSEEPSDRWRFVLTRIMQWFFVMRVKNAINMGAPSPFRLADMVAIMVRIEECLSVRICSSFSSY